MQTAQDFSRWCGWALCAAALLTIGVNLVLTPMLPRGSFDQLASSELFLARQSLAAAAAFFMQFGIIGLHVARLGAVRSFEWVAFLVAMFGAAALFATEWGQVFIVRDLALHAPDTLVSLEDAGDFTPFDIGALTAASAFFLGWLLLAISLLRSGRARRLASLLVLAGFVMAPALSAAGLDGPLAIAGASAIIGAGWLLLGLDLARGRFAAPGGAP